MGWEWSKMGAEEDILWKEVREDWGRLHNEEFHDFYFHQIRVMKAWRMKSVGHVECMEELRITFWVWRGGGGT